MENKDTEILDITEMREVKHPYTKGVPPRKESSSNFEITSKFYINYIRGLG